MKVLSCMKIAIAVLTWNRLNVLIPVLEALQRHCSDCKIAVFEDAGIKDKTVQWAMECAPNLTKCPNLLSVKCTGDDKVEFYLGTENLGVAGNSNRAIKWFMDSDCDFLCLMNDDVLAKGDFTKIYAEAWEKFKIGLFCYCGFTSPEYACRVVQTNVKSAVNGEMIRLKKLSRLTGSMMAFPRALIEAIGYFDINLGKFGEEHCEITTRANIMGFQNVLGENWTGIDVHHDLLEQLPVPSSMSDHEKKICNAEAARKVTQIDYVRNGLYRSFKLKPDGWCAGVESSGMFEADLVGWTKLDGELEESVV